MTDKLKGLKRYVWDASPSGSGWLFQCGAYPLPEHKTVLIPLRDIKEVLRKRWEKLNQAHDEWDINDEYGAAMCGGIEELEEIYLELTGEVLK